MTQKKLSGKRYQPDANHDKGIADTTQKGLKNTPLQQRPTAKKCCKKKYEIKILVFKDQR